jgi:predicted RNA-binding protein with PUA-like domain
MAYMAQWLFKEEPTHYSYDDLERDGETQWNGVANPLAVKYLRQVRAGDDIFYYHTGKEKAIVGLIRAAGDAQDSSLPTSVSVLVKPVRRLEQPVSLTEIKADPALRDWELTRLPRLSIMPVTAPQWRRVLAMARK